MKIVFKHISITNFLSFGEAELDLCNKGYTLINGINNNIDDFAKSNGSGKSSIFDAICWCLTGETIRGVKNDIVNIHTVGGCRVELSFDVDDIDYRLVRYRDHKDFGSNLKLFINNEDKSGKGIRDTQKILEDYLPDLTNELIGSIIILGQGLPQRFTNNTPSGRKEVLEKLSKSDFMIEDIKNKLSLRKSNLSEEIRKLEDSILSDVSKKSILESSIIALKNKLDNLIDYNEIDLIEYNAKNKLEELNKLQLSTQKELDNYNLLNDENNIKLYELSSKKLDSYIKVKDKYTNKLYEYNNLKVEYSSIIKSLNIEINNIKSIKDVCPTCGLKLPNVNKPNVDKQEKQLLEITIKYNDVNKLIDNLVTQQNDELLTIDASIGAIELEYNNKKEHFKSYINDLSIKLSNILSDINTQQQVLVRCKLQKEQYESDKHQLESDIDNANKTISEVDAKILYNNNEKDEYLSRLDCVNKMITLATRDFRGYLLTNVIDFIDSKSKEYAKEIFDTNKISFKLDGNNISISYDMKPYDNLSGGEKQKIDIIVQFAIRDMLCQFSNFSSNILVLDEIFDMLDTVGCQKVIDLITNKLIDIDSIFIITHHTDISIPSDSIITVVKNSNGISSIK